MYVELAHEFRRVGLVDDAFFKSIVKTLQLIIRNTCIYKDAFEVVEPMLVRPEEPLYL